MFRRTCNQLYKVKRSRVAKYVARGGIRITARTTFKVYKTRTGELIHLKKVINPRHISFAGR